MKHFTLLLALLTIVSCSQKDTSTKNEVNQITKPKFNYKEKLALKQKGMPQLEGNLTDYEGNSVPISDFDGKPKLISFWGYKCGANQSLASKLLSKKRLPDCHKSRYKLIELANLSPDLNVIIISLDTSFQDYKTHLESDKIGPTQYDFWIGQDIQNPLYWYSLTGVMASKKKSKRDTLSVISSLLISEDGVIVDNRLPDAARDSIRLYSKLARHYAIDPADYIKSK